MARCGCSGASCSCVIQGQGGVAVSGAGSTNNPYVISSDINMGVQDTSTINLTLTGDGSDANPWTIAADATVDLDHLTDVDTAGATTGQVLAKQADGTYRFVPATTAAVGAINVGNGIQGDGSAGNTLRLLLAPSSGLIVDGTGLRLQSGGPWTAYTPAWTASTTNPTLGNGTCNGWYAQNGKTVDYSLELVIGSTTKRGVGNYRFSLPVPPAATRRQVSPAHVGRYGVADYVGVANILSGRIDRIVVATGTSGYWLSHSVPATLPTGSIIAVTGTYEAA